MMIYTLNILLFFFIYAIFLRLAIKIKFVDKANKRKKHKGEIPLVGGLIIVVSVFIICFLNDSFVLNNLFKIILYSSLIVFFIGLLDDYMDVPPYVRLVFQLLAVMIVIGNHLSITSLGNLPLSIYLKNYGYILTIISVIILINAYNFIDGSDGNCASNFLFSLCAIIFYLYYNDKVSLSINSFLFLIIFNVCLFLFINIPLLPIKKVFLGDSGSTWLGYVLAWILIYLSEFNYINPLLIPWFIAMPVFDLLRLLIMRPLAKQSPFTPDRMHLHHIIERYIENRFLILGFTLFLNIIFLLSGIYITENFTDFMSFIFYIIFFIFYYLMILILKKNKY